MIDLVVDNRGKTPPTVEYKTEFPLIEVNAINTSDCLVNYNVIRKYVVEETYNTWFRKHLNVNDVIVSTVGTIGVFSIFTSNIGCIAQNLIGLRSETVSPYFIYLFLKTNKEDILNLDIGGVQPSIKVPHLLDLKLKKPTIEVINKFHNLVKEYFNKIGANQQQIQTLTKLRDTLLPKLMSGEVRVKI
jgi:type I restriction enzyme S subunit